MVFGLQQCIKQMCSPSSSAGHGAGQQEGAGAEQQRKERHRAVQEACACVRKIATGRVWGHGLTARVLDKV